MLVNGVTLGYSATGGASITYTNLPDLKEVPDLGAEPEMVDNTALSDTIRHNEQGIGDPGDMEYTFRYVNKASTDSFRVIQARIQDYETNGNLTYFKHELPDGTSYTFSGIPALRLSGGGVNDPQEFVMSIALQSSLTINNPSA